MSEFASELDTAVQTGNKPNELQFVENHSPSIRFESSQRFVAARDELIERIGHVSTTNELEYHTLSHSMRVAEGYLEFAQMIHNIDPTLISAAQLELGYLVALGHDLIQAGDSSGNIRVRHRGPGKEGNEGKTADEAYNILVKYYPQAEVNYHEVYLAIASTYVQFNPGMRIVQNLSKFSSMQELLTAYADLPATVGTREYDQFHADNFNEFRELHTGITREIMGGVNEIPLDRQASIVRSIIDWQRGTNEFIRWQAFYFNAHLVGGKTLGQQKRESGVVEVQVEVEPNESLQSSEHRSEIIGKLKGKFSRFEENMQRAQDLYTQAIDNLVGPEQRSAYLEANPEQQEEILRDALRADKNKFYRMLEFAGYI